LNATGVLERSLDPSGFAVAGDWSWHHSFLLWQDFSEMSTERLGVHNVEKL